MSDNKVFNPAEKAKLIHLVNEGIRVMDEVEMLNGGLSDTVKAIAEEMDIKPGVLKKAIKVAFKSNFHQATDEYELLENILDAVGRTD